MSEDGLIRVEGRSITIIDREGLREQAEAGQDLPGGLDGHRDQPVDRQQEECDVEDRDEGAFTHHDVPCR